MNTQTSQRIDIKQYQKPLPLWQDALGFGVSATFAFLTFYRQGHQAESAVDTLGFLGPAKTIAKHAFTYTSPIPLIFFSTLNAYELWEFAFRDGRLFFQVLCKQKLRLLSCISAAFTSAYLASESDSDWWILAISVFSSITTNGSFFIFRHAYNGEKENLIGTANWLKANDRAIVNNSDANNETGLKKTQKFKNLLEQVIDEKDNYLRDTKKKNLKWEVVAWAAFFLPTAVYLASGAKAGCWAGHHFSSDACDITKDHLSDSWPWFLMGLGLTGTASFLINGFVNYLGTHRLSEEFKSSNSDGITKKVILHGFASVMTLSFLMFNIGVNANNAVFEGAGEVQAFLSVFVAPVIYFSLYGFPRRFYQKLIERAHMEKKLDDTDYFNETVGRLPPAKLHQLIQDSESRESKASNGSPDRNCFACLFPKGDDTELKTPLVVGTESDNDSTDVDFDRVLNVDTTVSIQST